MSVFGVDYAWGRPGAKALQAAGVHFAARYLSHDTSGKNLSAGEAQALSDAGIWLVVVWETTATRALDGRSAGVADAQAAAAQAKDCGMPAGRPIYFAVDFDATGRAAEILPYFAGAASVLGADRVGIYGGLVAVRAVLDSGHAKWAWQTYAWSGGRWDSRAQLQQYSNDHVIGGVGLDFDRGVDGDYGQWRVGVSPAPTPQPPQQEEDMPYGRLDNGPKAITPISLPAGSAKAIGFGGDNGLQVLPAALLRVAVHDKNGWHVSHGVKVDSAAKKAVVHFADPATTDEISVQREDDGAVNIAWDAS